MLNMENKAGYFPGDIVWWYDDDSRLVSGRVHQCILRAKEGSVVYVDKGDGMCRAVMLWKCWPSKRVAAFMWHASCMLSAMGLFIIWGLSWTGLEYLIYGEVQPRIVDDIVSIPVIVALYLMFRYKSERDRLKK